MCPLRRPHCQGSGERPISRVLCHKRPGHSLTSDVLQLSESYFRHTRNLLNHIAAKGHPIDNIDGGIYLSKKKVC
jgi:hypothetical protein